MWSMTMRRSPSVLHGTRGLVTRRRTRLGLDIRAPTTISFRLQGRLHLCPVRRADRNFNDRSTGLKHTHIHFISPRFSSVTHVTSHTSMFHSCRLLSVFCLSCDALRRNFGNYPRVYTASHHKSRQCTFSPPWKKRGLWTHHFVCPSVFPP
jgi:hypothetical protein